MGIFCVQPYFEWPSYSLAAMRPTKRKATWMGGSGWPLGGLSFEKGQTSLGWGNQRHWEPGLRQRMRTWGGIAAIHQPIRGRIALLMDKYDSLCAILSIDGASLYSERL